MKKKILTVILSAVTLFSTVAFSACGSGGTNDTSSTTEGTNPEDSSQTEVMEVEVDNMIELTTWFATSGIGNNFVRIIYPNETATFECSIEKGMMNYDHGVKKYTLKSGEEISWHPDELEDYDLKQAYFDVVMKEGEKIAGYAVIEILPTQGISSCCAFVLHSAIFPKEQSVTEQQVNALIEKVKADNIKPIEEEGTDFIRMQAATFTQNETDNILIFEYPHERAVLECFTNVGEFKNQEERGRSITVKAGESFSWVPPEKNEAKNLVGRFAFIIKSEDNILGYAVFSINADINLINIGNCKPRLMKNIFFPQIDGAYQKVDEAKVKKYINKFSASEDIIQ